MGSANRNPRHYGELVSYQLDNQQIETDRFGYLKHTSDWSKPLAELIASGEGIALTDAHWEVITFVRDFYQTYNTSPAIRLLVKEMEKAYGPERGNSRYLYKLFPKGPAKQATKIAGLPKPARCI